MLFTNRHNLTAITRRVPQHTVRIQNHLIVLSLHVFSNKRYDWKFFWCLHNSRQEILKAFPSSVVSDQLTQIYAILLDFFKIKYSFCELLQGLENNTVYTYVHTNLLIFSCLLSRWQISCNDRECPLPGEIPGESKGGSLSSTGGILHRAPCTSALDSDTISSSRANFIRRDSSFKLKSLILLSCLVHRWLLN